MNKEKIMKILRDTARVRTGGSQQELETAQYLQGVCKNMGLDAHLEAFEVDMATMHTASLHIDGKEIPCKGYFNCGSGEVEAPLCYLTSTDAYSLSQVKGKIVLIDGYMRHWMYQDLLEHGALAFISYDGNANFVDSDIDQRELRAQVHNGKKILGVSINAKDAIKIVKNDGQMAKIVVKQDEYKGNSHNVVAEIKGEIPQTIVFTAHYDSTSLSQGVYDNMSGSVGLVGIAEYFAKHQPRHTLKFVWCGSEERGLLGSKAYCAMHEEQLKDVVLCINLDMIGSIMGRFIACCTSEEALVHYVQYFAKEVGKGISANQDVYSSDSTPFADKGVPAISFARLAPGNTAPIHNRYDTLSVMKAEHMQEDIEFILEFAKRMANSACCPVERKMPDNMKDKLDLYLCRKRGK